MSVTKEIEANALQELSESFTFYMEISISRYFKKNLYLKTNNLLSELFWMTFKVHFSLRVNFK